MKNISKVLVANRGEIAVRVIQGVQKLGLKAVAVFSEADAQARHVQVADEAYPIGASPANQSYLRQERIIEVARNAGADAIHPGYGFLAENADFARACAQAGIRFIGPSAEAIDLMGNKRAAKVRMIEAGVPCVPGYEGQDQDDATLIQHAEKIGCPIMIKAAAGGGGRGMRLCESPDQLATLIRSARAEAESAFGSGELILEKAVVGARHVEIQVFGDSQGQVVHLFERDCSIQRRHQKVVEESPSPAVDADLRARMGEAAVKAAAAIDYVGAGTVEFLLGADKAFYFLEMNTRLQVEHPVTEMVTGQDLVEWQLRVADGEPLPCTQQELGQRGHAIEVRLCAEDPRRDSRPQTGPILRWELPGGEGVRVDHGLLEGGALSPYYDSMVAKVIAHGPTRDAARLKLRRALHGLRLHGVTSNQDYLDAILGEQDFIAGDFHTGYVGSHFPQEALAEWGPRPVDYAVAALVLWWDDAHQLYSGADFGSDSSGWRSANPIADEIKLRWEGRDTAVHLLHEGDRHCRVEVEGEVFQLTAGDCDGRVRQLVWDNSRRSAAYTRNREAVWLSFEHRTWCFEDVSYEAERPAAPGSDGRIVAHSDGRIVDIRVAVGEDVAEGATIVSLEAMKMEFQLTTPVPATVREIHVQAGDQVANRQLLVTLEPRADD